MPGYFPKLGKACGVEGALLCGQNGPSKHGGRLHTLIDGCLDGEDDSQ